MARDSLQIRTILASEADEYLRLLCTVFGLDATRARQAFFGEPFFSLSRKWAAIADGRIVGGVTTVPLLFAKGQAIGIAGVATLSDYRQQGIAQALLAAVLEYAAQDGCGSALLFANQSNLYEKCGFVHLDDVVSQPLPTSDRQVATPVDVSTIRHTYDEWSQADERRLLRDDKRWDYWKWNLRSAYELGHGYATLEFGRVREVLPAFSEVVFADTAEWYGLKSLATDIGVPLTDPRREMMLMGWNFDFVPQMFLTDQF